MGHIELSRGMDPSCRPATADFIAKLAHGLADDLLLPLPGTRVPAARRACDEPPDVGQRGHAPQRRAVAGGRDRVLGPASGDQACGEVGMGRMLEAADWAEAVTATSPQDPPGCAIPDHGRAQVRTESTRCAVSQPQFWQDGLLHCAGCPGRGRNQPESGPVILSAPAGADVVRTETAAKMFEAVKRHVASADVYIGVAAVADYRVDQPRKHKIKKTDESQLSIKLVPNPDILGWVAARPKGPFCVGFAAESRNLDQYADEKRRRKKVQLMVANLAQEAIGSDDNEVSLLDDSGTHRLARAPKDVVARQIIDHIAKLYRSRSRRRN